MRGRKAPPFRQPIPDGIFGLKGRFTEVLADTGERVLVIGIFLLLLVYEIGGGTYTAGADYALDFQKQVHSSAILPFSIR